MKSGTSYWTLPFVIHKLLTLAVLIGLQNHLLDKLTNSCAAVAVAIPPQYQAGAGGATVAFVESFQLNAFDTTRTTLPSASSASSLFEPAGGTQISSLSSSSSYPTSFATSLQPSLVALTSAAASSSSHFSSLSSSSAAAATYPTSSSSSTTSSGFHRNSKTSRIMSNLNSISSSIHPISPTLSTPTANLLQTSLQGNSDKGGSGKFLMGIHQTRSTLDFHTDTTMGISSSVLPSLKSFMKSSSISSSSSSSSGFNAKHQFPSDFTFSKNHWTNSDAAFTGGAVGAAAALPVAGVGLGNFRLGPSSTSALSSASSSLVSETERPRIFRNRHHHEQHWGPFFEEPLNSSTSGDNSITTAHLYTEAVLNCRVGMLKDKTVMWVRRTSEKVSLLTVGNVTYSSDPRIRVKFQYPNNWRLLINPTQWDDAGIYMCQVSTHPPRVFTTNLTVIEPPLRLIDDQERDVGDRYYKTGSTIDLHCQVSRSFLYKEKQNILKSLKPLNVHNTKNNNHNNNSNASNSNTNTNKNQSNSNNNSSNSNQNKTPTNKNIESSSVGTTNGIGSTVNSLFPSVHNETAATDIESHALEKQFSSLVFWSKDEEELPPAAQKRLSSDEKWLTSRVTISDAKLTDSGNYSCSIGRLFMAIVQVQVLTGELPAAVQHNSAAAPSVLRQPVGLQGFESTLMQFSWLIYFATAFLCDYFFVMNVNVIVVN